MEQHSGQQQQPSLGVAVPGGAVPGPTLGTNRANDPSGPSRPRNHHHHHHDRHNTPDHHRTMGDNTCIPLLHPSLVCTPVPTACGMLHCSSLVARHVWHRGHPQSRQHVINTY